MDAEIILVGALGGIAKSLMEENGRVALPYLEQSDHIRYLHLGILFNIILGAIASYLFAKDTFTAFLIGGAAAFYLESALEKTVINGKNKTPE
jgi:hypothetical protein